MAGVGGWRGAVYGVGGRLFVGLLREGVLEVVGAEGVTCVVVGVEEGYLWVVWVEGDCL